MWLARALILLSPSLVFSVALTSSPRRIDLLRAARKAGRVVVSPSVAKADFYCLGQELQEVVDAGAEWLHFSVQDGRMVPKISFGAPVISSLRDRFPDTIFDIKLGVIEPEHRVADFIKAGADIVSVHPEATLQLPAVLNLITSADCAAGVVLNPGTPVSAIEPVLEMVDVIVIMLVNPGYGGPKYMDLAIRKMAELGRLCAERGVDPWIEVDGGVSATNAQQLIHAGANALVAGGSIFTAKDKRAALRGLRPSEILS
jgi:ribulose-phosphate 3-epimerase